MNATAVMDSVVARLVDAIEAGAADWQMPWRTLGSTGWPTNAATGNRYSTGAVWVFERREWVGGLVPCGPADHDVDPDRSIGAGPARTSGSVSAIARGRYALVFEEPDAGLSRVDRLNVLARRLRPGPTNRLLSRAPFIGAWRTCPRRSSRAFSDTGYRTVSVETSRRASGAGSYVGRSGPRATGGTGIGVIAADGGEARRPAT